MNRRVRRGLAAVAAAACIACILLPRPLLAQGEAVGSSECCAALLFIIGGRALGLGDAIAARTAPASLFVNPALLAGVPDDQFVIHNADTSIEESTTLSVVIESDVAGNFAVSYRLIDLGEQEAFNENGIPTGSLSVLSQVLTATYATAVLGGLNAGANYTLYQFRQDCRGFCNGDTGFSATTHGLDLGLQYLPAGLPELELGFSVTHLGFPLQVINKAQASPLPLRFRGGLSYEAGHHFLADSTFAVWTSVDVVSNPREGRTYVNVGVDVSLEETIFLRGGYSGNGGTGAAAGVGVKYDRFVVDIAKSFVTSPIDEFDPIQVSFSIRF